MITMSSGLSYFIDTKIFPKSRGAYIVGGAIRDMLCDRTPLDYDIAVLADPDAFARQVARNTNGRLVEIGKPGQEIIRVVAKETMIDISKVKGKSIDADLRARDYSINAMAYDLFSNQLIDPLGGRSDLAHKTIRMVSKGIFNQDPLRLLRAFRMAAVLQFKIESHTKTAIEKHAGLIQQSAGERVREELFKMLQSAKCHDYLCQMADTGLLFAILPELAALKQCRQNRFHQFDVFEHTLGAHCHLERLLDSSPEQALLRVKNAPLAARIAESRRPLLKLSILLHDIGKPAVQTTDGDGNLHFYSHERQSAQMTEAICRRLKCSTRDADSICFLVRHHTRPLSLFTALNEQNAHPRAITRFFIKSAEHIGELLVCAAADMLAKQEDQNDRSRAFIKFANRLLAQFETDFKPKKSKPPLINGQDLINKFSLKPSPLFKEILDRLEEERLSRNDMTRREAEALVRRLIRDQK
ncbi:MAG: HD domain-containing protein [Desulfobacterales bacterium]